ncbi:COG2426 family protein [Feifania hominis]|nr:small multi-drug export protein [Feifania hominis]
MPFFSQLHHVLYVMGLSMVPVIELRGSIFLGAGLGLPWVETFVAAVIGNMIPVPFIILLGRQILKLLKKIPLTMKLGVWLEEKALAKSDKIRKYSFWGLVLFVGIPLPGTGAWTGALIACLLRLRLNYALPAIFIGVLAAGFIVSGVAYGFLGFLSFLA